MTQPISINKKFTVVIIACLLIGGITMSFQNTPFGPFDNLDTLTETQDTLPEKHKEGQSTMTMKDFDQLLQHLDKEMLNAHAEINQINFDKIQKEITASLDKVDFDKIKMNIDKAMKEIDIAKIDQGVNSALKEIEWNKINNQVKMSLLEAKKEIERINMEEVKKEIEKAKKEIQKSREEIKKINIDEIMKHADEGVAKAKQELHLTKQLFIEMEKDGLISQKDGFTIEYKNKSLFINGKLQPEVIKEKYLPYIKEDTFKISISKE